MDWTEENGATKGFAGSASSSPWEVGTPSTHSERRVNASFSLMTDGTNTYMYVPANSVTVNGKALTPTGLTAHDITDWYVVTSFTSGLNLYVVFDDTDGQWGKPISAEFGTSAPTGKVITIPILAYAVSKFVNLTLGAIYAERPSFDGDCSASAYKSIEKATGGAWTNEDHTLQVAGFRNGTAPCGCLLCSGDSYSHALAVRESDGTCADMRWVADSELAEAVGQWLVDNCSWVCDGGGSSDFCLDTSFFDWYCGLADGPFWEQGADACVNYGPAIGDSTQALAIDLDSRTLENSWIVGDDLCVTGDICSAGLFVSTLFSYQGCTINICTTNGLLYAT